MLLCRSYTTYVPYTHSRSIGLKNIEGVPAICFRGRFHFYEGHEMNTVALPVRVMRAMGVKVSACSTLISFLIRALRMHFINAQIHICFTLL